MLVRTLLVLSLLGATQFVVSDPTTSNDKNHPETLDNTNSDFILVNPKQVGPLERTIKLLLGRLAAPIRQPVALRSSSANDTALQRTISQISWSVRKKLQEFAEACGLQRSARAFEQFRPNATKDWFSAGLLEGSLVLTDLGNIADDLSVSTGNYFQEHDVLWAQDSEDTSVNWRNNGVEFLGTVDDFARYSEKITRCLKNIADSNKQGFNLNTVLLNYLKASPRHFARTLRTRLDKSLSKSKSYRFNQVHMVICASLINKAGEYSECIEQLDEMNRCLANSSNNAVKSAIAARTFDKQWNKSIKLLSNCKVDAKKSGETFVTCKSRRKMPTSVRQRVKYIYEKMLNEKVSKESQFYRAASELGDALSKSEIGEKFSAELWQYLAIHEQGQRKLEKLAKSIGTDPKIRARYRKVSKALQVYKRGLHSRTINAIGKVHKSVYDVEKLLVRQIRTGLSERWFGHIGILTCLANWMATLMQLLFGKEEGTTNTPTPTTTPLPLTPVSNENSESGNDRPHGSGENRIYLSLTPSKTEMTKLVDKSMKDLMKSMQHVGKYRSPHDRSTLARLANNLLLVAMFMETIGFISTLFCVGRDQQQQSNSEEMYNAWGNRYKRHPDINPILLNHSPFQAALERNVTVNYFENDWRAYEELIPYPEFNEEEDPVITPVTTIMSTADDEKL